MNQNEAVKIYVKGINKSLICSLMGVYGVYGGEFIMILP